MKSIQPQSATIAAKYGDLVFVAINGGPGIWHSGVVAYAAGNYLHRSASVSAHGRQLDNVGNSTATTVGAGDLILPVGNQVTILLQGYRVGTGGGDSGAAFFGAQSAGSDDCNLYLPFSDGNIYWRWGGEVDGTSSLSVAVGAVSPNDVWALTAGPRGMEIWKNFNKIAANAGSSSRSSSGVQPFVFGAALPSDGNWSLIQFSLFAALKKQMPQDFLSSGDYWKIFARPERRKFSAWVAIPVSVQLLRPLSPDIAAGGWTPSTGTDLYAMLDEVTADDGDYIRSPDNPTTQQAEVKVSAGTAGSYSTCTVRVRLQAIGIDTNFDIDLVQGTTVLASWTEAVTVAAGAVTREHVASSISITDATDLRLRVVARA